MQVSYFETGRYYAPSNLPREWPMPAGAYDREAGLRAFRGMVERSLVRPQFEQDQLVGIGDALEHLELFAAGILP